jgi:putative acetyltransferase
MEIRSIDIKDNLKLAVVIRSVLIEMGIPKKGTAYEDQELDSMYDAYLYQRAHYYVVSQGETVLGGAGVAPLKDGDPSVCELQKMYFSPSARGKGLGHLMIETCIEFAKAKIFKLCYIETMPNMEAAQKLYKKVGFNYIDQSMGNTGHCSCSIWMTKSLI